MKRAIILTLTLIVATTTLHAQHTLGVMGGFGSGSESIYPAVEGRTVYGLANAGISWRTYSDERVVGCFGLDLQYMQRAFSFSPTTSAAVDGEELYYYTRRLNTIMLPVVWQPHFYIADHRVRVFFEAAATFSYDINSTYDNDYQKNLDEKDGTYNPSNKYEGTYEYMTARDNRFGYGLFGGGGIAILVGKFEILGRVRYYIGLADIVRNRNKYYSNNNDGYENPFSLTPIRSSINNITASFGINYHFGPSGFKSWRVKRVKAKIGREFNYTGEGFTNQDRR
ncbi:MAG: outer membrane beta-barrel protein [Rikenellaceae bacterium]